MAKVMHRNERLTRHYADLHIHVGYSRHSGPVKITASRRLTLPAILEECTSRKGIDVAAVVDCETRGVRRDLAELVDQGALVPVNGGGYLYEDRLLVIPAAEVEAVEEDRSSSHWVGYFPTIDAVNEFAAYLSHSVTNLDLSSQRTFRTARELVRVINECGGRAVPAHAFTPYRGVYGNATDNLARLLQDQAPTVRALELGLSSDTDLADLIPGNRRLAYMSNSDAHSTQKIAREHNELLIARPSYNEVWKALLGIDGRAVTANYGLDPRLGKYHRTYCLDCEQPVTEEPPVRRCSMCGGDRVVMGVVDRIVELSLSAPGSERTKGRSGARPPYHYQVPLEFVPGVGPRTLARLVDEFGSEMNVLHTVSPSDLAALVGEKTAAAIVRAREGKTRIEVGGGGRYGRVRRE